VGVLWCCVRRNEKDIAYREEPPDGGSLSRQTHVTFLTEGSGKERGEEKQWRCKGEGLDKNNNISALCEKLGTGTRKKLSVLISPEVGRKKR